jgi:hypothetical protein
MTTSLPPSNILYLDTSFRKNLSNDLNLKVCLGRLREFYKYDSIIMPFFFNEPHDKRALVVLINPETCTVDLYDRERETDSKRC